MSQAATARKALRPLVCPVCAAPSEVDIVLLTRKGGMTCPTCDKHLKTTDVVRAMQSPRTPIHYAPGEKPAVRNPAGRQGAVVPVRR